MSEGRGYNVPLLSDELHLGLATIVHNEWWMAVLIIVAQESELQGREMALLLEKAYA